MRHVITNLMEYFLEHPEEMREEPPSGGASGSSTLTLETAAERAGRRLDPAAARLELIQAVTDYISGMTDRYASAAIASCSSPIVGRHMSVAGR